MVGTGISISSAKGEASLSLSHIIPAGQDAYRSFLSIKSADGQTMTNFVFHEPSAVEFLQTVRQMIDQGGTTMVRLLAAAANVPMNDSKLHGGNVVSLHRAVPECIFVQRCDDDWHIGFQGNGTRIVRGSFECNASSLLKFTEELSRVLDIDLEWGENRATQ